MSEEPSHHLVHYGYVEDILERRAPYREEHLARIRAARDAGQIVMVGPLGDPQPDDVGAAGEGEAGSRAGGRPTGAAIVFRGVELEAIENWIAEDPYVKAGLVTGWRVDLWKLL
jgi:uncharacterized protein